MNFGLLSVYSLAAVRGMYDLYSSNPQPAGANVCRERISGTDQMVGSLEIHTSGAN
jgi:hypothetical protein